MNPGNGSDERRDLKSHDVQKYDPRSSAPGSEGRTLVEQLGSALRRRKLQIALFTAIGFLAAAAVIHRMPPTYKTSAVIVVDDPPLPAEYVRTTVGLDVDARLRTLREKVLGQGQLTRIVKTFNLYASGHHGIESRVEELRKHLDVKVEGTTSFGISFEARDPATAAAVVNRVASSAVTENTESRLNRARDTKAFLQRQIDELQPQVTKAEDALRHYRITHKGSLPDELDANLREMEQSRMLLGRSSEMLAGATARRRALVHESATAYRRDEEDLSRALIDARARYTNQHPELIRLEKEHASAVARRRAEERRAQAAISTSAVAVESSREIGEMKAVIGTLNRQIKTYESRIGETAKHSDGLALLTREYVALKDRYAGLSTRLFEADLALGLENQFKGSRFMLVDRAVPPSMPSKPNKPELYAVALAAALLLSLGIAVMRESLDRSVHDPKGVRAAFGEMTVLACVPRIGRISRAGGAAALMASSHWGQLGAASKV